MIHLLFIYKSINFIKKYYLFNYIYKVYFIIKSKYLLYNYLIKLKKYKINLIYLNIINLILMKGYNKSYYLIIFTYNYFKLIIIYLIKIKNNIINYFIYFKK